MARRRSLLDDLVTLPWWFNLSLAAIVYVSLKYYLPGVEFQSPVFRGISDALPQLAGIFSGILIFTAALSAYLAWRKGELLDRQTSINSIKDLPWKDFEYLVAEAYRRQGYSVQENTGGGADGGVDLVLEKEGRTTLVQCKNWRSKSVGVTTIRELFGVVTAEGAAEGIVVCSGYYTRDAIAFADGKPLTLVDGSDLARLIGDVQKSPEIQPELESTACPVCGSTMVMRVAKKGKNAGSSFWGCSRFPKCRGTTKLR
jgi:restriction system protein